MRRFIRGLFLGGLVGTITGLLTAPKRGRETRKDINKQVDTLRHEVDELTTRVVRELEAAERKAAPKVKKVGKALQKAVESAREEAISVTRDEEADLRSALAKASEGPGKPARRRK